jgi:hypothetical protein
MYAHKRLFVGLADMLCFIFLVLIIEGKSDSTMANAKFGSVFRP